MTILGAGPIYLGSQLIAGGGGGGGKDPTQVAGLCFWIDAMTITGLSPTDPVASWTELTSGNTPVQASSGNQPTYQTSAFGGRPTVLFDGSNDRLVAPAPATTVIDNFMIASVFMLQPGVPIQRCSIFNGDGASDGWGVAPRASGSGYVGFLRGGIAWGATNTMTPPVTAQMVLVVRRTGGTWNVRWNGINLGSSTPGAPSTPTSAVYVGAAYSGDSTNAHIAEAVIYNQAVSDSDCMELETYWSHKWGIPCVVA